MEKTKRTSHKEHPHVCTPTHTNTYTQFLHPKMLCIFLVHLTDLTVKFLLLPVTFFLILFMSNLQKKKKLNTL